MGDGIGDSLATLVLGTNERLWMKLPPRIALTPITKLINTDDTKWTRVITIKIPLLYLKLA